MAEPDRYWHDVDWWIVKKLKSKFGISIVKDNSIERGPMKAISSRRVESDEIFKFHYTTSHQQNMQASLHDQQFPCHTDEYAPDTLRHLRTKPAHPASVKSLVNNGWIADEDSELFNPNYQLFNNDHEYTGYSYTPLDYYIGKQGFRHDGSTPDYYSETGGAIYIGDSHTMAVGMPIDKSWTYLAHHKCSLTKDLRYMNMGMPGYGIDAYYRLLKRHMPFIKPNYVIMSFPWQTTRAEVWSPKFQRWHN